MLAGAAYFGVTELLPHLFGFLRGRWSVLGPVAITVTVVVFVAVVTTVLTRLRRAARSARRNPARPGRAQRRATAATAARPTPGNVLC